jgi:hypothetical protein
MRKIYKKILDWFKEEELEPLTCSKCGSEELYIACPDYCYDCHVKYELKGKKPLTNPK